MGQVGTHRDLVEVMSRYSNRPDLLGPMLDVLRRIGAGDRGDEPGRVVLREGGSLRTSDRLSDADVSEIVERFRAGEPKHRLAVAYGMSLSTMKRLLRKYRR
jgi:DNA invertase Pin-like site-specific DNA recombinase